MNRRVDGTPNLTLLNRLQDIAIRGNCLAQWILAEHYLGSDDQEAARWFHKAAEAGDRDAQFILAGLYGRGQGLNTNRKRAFELFDLASQNPSTGEWEESRAFLKDLARTAGRIEAVRLLQGAAAHGSQLAQMAIAHSYASEYGREFIRNEAFRWYRRVALHGNQEVEHRLTLESMPPVSKALSMLLAQPVGPYGERRKQLTREVPKWRKWLALFVSVTGMFVLILLMEELFAVFGLPTETAEEGESTVFGTYSMVVCALLAWRTYFWITSGSLSGNLTVRQRWWWRLCVVGLTVLITLLAPLWLVHMSPLPRGTLAVVIAIGYLWAVIRLVDRVEDRTRKARLELLRRESAD